MENTIADKIHFLNTGSSDCIILESCGRFAMIDSGEDTEYPPEKPHLNLKGYEEEVIAYLLKNCRGGDGKVTLDFVLGTHAHSDHIGGFDTIIRHPDIMVKKAYLKPYDESQVFIMERLRWDNREVYEQMLRALNDAGTPVCTDFDGERLTFGNFSVTFLCGSVKKRSRKLGENVNSVVTLIEKDGTKLLLTGDMNYKDGDERRVAKEVGKIDLLKVGHHGYVGSTSLFMIKKLMPKFAIVTNWERKIFPDVRFKLKKIAHSEIRTTADENGIIACIGANGSIRIENNIM